MPHQLKEKTIYSESDLLHFGEKAIFGDIINSQFPDYSGISLGAVIYQNENKNKVHQLKTQLEISRLRILNEMLVTFFDDDELAERFYASNEFTKLQEMYRQVFGLNLIQRTANLMEVEGNSFYIPPEATNEQVLEIQKLLNIYFFTVTESTEADETVYRNVDWESRFELLYLAKKEED